MWWQDVFAAQHELGNDVMTLAPEHGPPNYQQTLPYTRQPIADIWSVNHWVALRQQVRLIRHHLLQHVPLACLFS